VRYLYAIVLCVLLNPLSLLFLDNDDNETGWKLVHGDVFRVPPNAMLLSACIGTGVQVCMRRCPLCVR